VTADVTVEKSVSRPRPPAGDAQETRAIIAGADEGPNQSSDSFVHAPVQGERNRGRGWAARYATRLWICDLIVLTMVVYMAQIAWFGTGRAEVAMREDHRLSDLSYWVFSACLIVLWLLGLSLADSRSPRVVGTGSTEYVRVANASFVIFSVVVIFCFLAKVDVARGYILIALPLGLALLLVQRALWRRWLVTQRRRGRFSARVLLVGSESSVAHIARELARTAEAGYRVVGACVPTGQVGATIEGTNVPVMGNVNDVSGAMQAVDADTVVVTSTDVLPAQKVKQISWDLESGKQHLVLAPSIADIAGPRIHTRPVSGLPLIHVETPRFSRGQAFLKRTMDVFGAMILILVASPVLVVVGALVALTSPGPLLYKQERIGRNGCPFWMLKFRSMRVGADRELQALLEAQGTTATPLFKIKDDPRITPIGRFIRKYSLDELPQLFNVLGGSMSLVGPRPQIAAEVALYSTAARRRLLARPGITGLWQVSGRSSMDWEDAVRLDLYYVENWSLIGDLVILAKTFRAVLRPGETAH